MTSRRKSREAALQALFSIDVIDGKDTFESSGEMVEDLCTMIELPDPLKDYFLDLVKGVFNHAGIIDRWITGTSSNWKLSRMSAVDRNIIRIAVYEMLYRSDIPPRVAINEAIEIGKKFGTDKSAPFINGILDSVYKNYTNQSKSGIQNEDKQSPPNAEHKEPS